jgi:hypothetical protein
MVIHSGSGMVNCPLDLVILLPELSICRAEINKQVSPNPRVPKQQSQSAYSAYNL